jgi:dTDP-4-dehydrorhamnose 3,5-epimerase
MTPKTPKTPRFEILPTALHGLAVLQRLPLGDARGFLERLYCADELANLLGQRRIVQVNHTHTALTGTVRGMHFQHPPHAETKLVSCLAGAVFDVAVDIRRDSLTFLHWHGEILSADNHRSLLIPEGFAHGFQTLSTDCQMLYLHTHAHHPEAEGGLHPQDPRLGITWPLPVAQLSARDAAHVFVADLPAPAGIAP